MPRIFISYRRADSQTFTGRIYDRLADAFGKDSLFMDVDDIPPGVDFRAYLQNEIAQADVVLVVIGPEWAKIMRRRRRQPNDFVRIELESALEQGKITIPVLLNGTPMPAPKDLPPRVDAVFPYLNAAQVRENPDFQRDMNRLINQLENWQNWPPPSPLPDAPEPSRRPSPVLLAGIVAVLAVMLIAAFVLSNNGDEPPADDTPESAPTNAVAQQDTPRPEGEGTGVRAETPTITLTPTATATLSQAELDATIAAQMDVILTDEARLQSTIAALTEDAVRAANRATANALTATATLWTPTPTIDIQATAEALLTATREAADAAATQAALDVTATADSWTPTPTATHTPTATPTPTLTPTLTPSVTPTETPDSRATFIAQAEKTATQNANLTATATLWTATPSVTPTLTPTPTLEPVPAALAAWEISDKTNADWTPIIETFDGVEMVLVPPGCFMMGSEDGASDEQPVHEICFDEPFWIDRYEVTNEQYGSATDIESCVDDSSEPDQPRNCVTWFEARDHCLARSARLPTEAEWEYAARGPDSLVYPWGDEWNEDVVVWGGNSNSQTAPVGSFPDGASWVDALDLSGNVWEWTSTDYEPYPYDAADGRENESASPTAGRVVRGGSFGIRQFLLRGANRNNLDQANYLGNVGFRCARPPSQ